VGGRPAVTRAKRPSREEAEETVNRVARVTDSTAETISVAAPAETGVEVWYELRDGDAGTLVGVFEQEDPALAVVRDAIARFGQRSKRVASYGLLRWVGKHKGLADS